MLLSEPTIGRVVHYWPYFGEKNDRAQKVRQVMRKDEEVLPHAAIITYVHNEHTVNLSVFDHDGRQYAALARMLVIGHPDNDQKREGGFASWPERVPPTQSTTTVSRAVLGG